MVCADYLIIFQNLLNFFFATFFLKQASKDYLTQANLLKMLLSENKAILKRKCKEIPLYSQYFPLGLEAMFSDICIGRKHFCYNKITIVFY